jgi:hypothetical protein
VWRSLGLLVLLLAGCQRGPPSLTLAAVAVDVPQWMQGADAASEQDAGPGTLRRTIVARLQADSSVSLRGMQRSQSLWKIRPTQPAYALQVRVLEQPVQSLQLRLQQLDGDQVWEASVQTSQPHPQGLLDAYDRAWLLLKQMRCLHAGSDAALLVHLEPPGAKAEAMQLYAYALQTVGERRLREAVPRLCDSLQVQDNVALLLRRVGALVAIGDARAVEPLIALSQHQEPAFVLQMAYAIGAIGGRRAEGYLTTLASGHPDDGVRHSAQQALEALLAARVGNAAQTAAGAPGRTT